MLRAEKCKCSRRELQILYPACVRGDRVQREEDFIVKVNGGVLAIVDKFCYLGEMMTC